MFRLCGDPLHAVEHRIAPVGYLQAESPLDLGFVQYGVGRAGHLRGKFAAVAGVDAARAVSRGRGDLHREVVPRAHALVREVVDALVADMLPARDHAEDGQRQVARIGGRSHLVEYHVERLALGREAQHGLQEVVAVLGVEPRRAENQVAAPRGQDRLLAFELGASVDAERLRGCLLRAGRVAAAPEHVVRGYVYERGAALACRIRQVRHGVAVDAARRRLVLLGPVHMGVGRAVHDDVRVLVAHPAAYRFAVGDVQFRHVGEDIAVGRRGTQATQLPAELSVGSRYEYVKHSSPCCSRRVRAHPQGAGGRCPWARAAPRGASAPSRCPARDRPTQWHPRPRGHRGCRTCTGTPPRGSAPRSRGRSRGARRTGVCSRP